MLDTELVWHKGEEAQQTCGHEQLRARFLTQLVPRGIGFYLTTEQSLGILGQTNRYS